MYIYIIHKRVYNWPYYKNLIRTTTTDRSRLQIAMFLPDVWMQRKGVSSLVTSVAAYVRVLKVQRICRVTYSRSLLLSLKAWLPPEPL